MIIDIIAKPKNPAKFPPAFQSRTTIEVDLPEGVTPYAFAHAWWHANGRTRTLRFTDAFEVTPK